MLMKAETAVHGCHCLVYMAVRMPKVLARQWVGVRVCHLLLLCFYINLLAHLSPIKADLLHLTLNMTKTELMLIGCGQRLNTGNLWGYFTRLAAEIAE